MNNLIGKKFGLLTVLSYSHPSLRSRGKHYWNCQCDCGNTSVVRDSHLQSKKIRSCGCLHKRRGKDSPFFEGHGELPKNYFSIVKRSAQGGGILKRKPKEFSVTIEYLWDLFLKQNRKCALSGIEIGFGGTTLENKCRETSKFTASLDRIDSEQGYIEGNVWWVHKDINIMKNRFDKETFLRYCTAVVNHNTR